MEKTTRHLLPRQARSPTFFVHQLYSFDLDWHHTFHALCNGWVFGSSVPPYFTSVAFAGSAAQQHNIILEADKHELSKNTDKSWYRRSRHHQILIKLAQKFCMKKYVLRFGHLSQLFPRRKSSRPRPRAWIPQWVCHFPAPPAGSCCHHLFPPRTRFPGFPKRGQRPKVLEPMPDAERKHEARSFTRLRLFHLFHRDFGWNDLGKMSINELGKKKKNPTTPKRTWPLKNGAWETFLFGKVPIFRYPTISFGEVNSEVQRAFWAFGTFLQVKKGARPKEAGSIYIYIYIWYDISTYTYR